MACAWNTGTASASAFASASSDRVMILRVSRSKDTAIASALPHSVRTTQADRMVDVPDTSDRFDRDLIEQYRSVIGPDGAREMVELFLRTLDERRGEIVAAVADGDLDDAELREYVRLAESDARFEKVDQSKLAQALRTFAEALQTDLQVGRTRALTSAATLCRPAAPMCSRTAS